MFQYDPAKLARVVAATKAAIAEEFSGADGTDEFAKYAVLGELIGPYKQSIGWALDYYYAKKGAKVLPGLVALHAELEAGGRTVAKKFEIGSCDRYAAYVPDENNKVLAFCNQNVSYVVVLVPTRSWSYKDAYGSGVDTYTMHIRMFTTSPRGNDPIASNFNNDYEKTLRDIDSKFENRTNTSEYFKYLDMRDRGYIMTLTPAITAKYSDVFYVAKDMGSANAATDYIIEELECYCSMMDTIVEEIKEGTK